jgi:hypothetical protein
LHYFPAHQIRWLRDCVVAPSSLHNESFELNSTQKSAFRYE